MAQLAALFQSRPKPRCPACHKWNRVYVTGGSFLSACAYCGAALDRHRAPAWWGLGVILVAGALALAVIPLLTR